MRVTQRIFQQIMKNCRSRFSLCFYSIVFLVLWLASAAAAMRQGDNGTFEYDENILKNGGFEQGLRNPWGTGRYSTGKPVWWNSSSCRSRALITEKAAKSGMKSLFIENTSSRSPHVFGTTAQRIPVTSGQRYRLVLWAGARDLASNGAVNFAVDNNWQVRPVSLPAGSFPWSRFDGMFTPSEKDADVRIIVEDRGRVWLDDIKVVPDLDLSVHTTSGQAWSGREGDGWDFVAYEPRYLAADRLLFQYAAQHTRSGRLRRGEMRVTSFGNHMKAELIDSDGYVRRGYDGVFSDDGSMVWGSSWPRPASSPSGPERYGWWATIERKVPFDIPATVDLNRASVAQLEALGLSGRSARTLVEGRILGRPFHSVREAGQAPGLMGTERKILTDRCVAE